MIRTRLLQGDGSCASGGEELIRRWRDTPDSRLWLDVESEPTEEVRELLRALDCNDLAIIDSFRARHPPKVESFGDTTFILFRGISSIDESLELVPQQIGVWVGERHLITVHRGHSVSVSHFWEQEDEQQLLRRPGILAVQVLHYASGRYLEKLLDFEDHLGDLEDGLLSDRSEEGMRELVGYRSRLRRLRRIFSYHKELAQELLDEESLLPGSEDGEVRHVCRDLFDRCERLNSLCQMYYEICGDLVEGHISVTSHKLNQTMKILTIISALFVPLTFMAGIYGMNFEHMPELSWKYAYFSLLAVMAIMAMVMLVIFRRARWL